MPSPERIPTDAELREAGVELGLIEPGEKVPPRLYKKLVRVVQDTWREEAADVAVEDAREHAADVALAFSEPIADHMYALQGRGISETSAARIVAAIAPHIWRDINKGGAHS